MSRDGPADLSAEDWRRVSELLDELMDLHPDQQEQRLVEVGREAPEFVLELRQLLASDQQAGGFLDAPAAEVLETLIRKVVDDGERPPESAGPYRIVRELGRGGMGVVYLAERSDGEFEQRVALKLVKRGLDTDAILARFRRERQILARLQHRAIARLFDGGAVDDGRPYFAMEFVDGEPLAEACDRARMTVDGRLRLFLDVCAAVQYAHGQLVVHRDLKPSNILLDRAGDVKLLDFGIARLLDEEGEGPTQMTAASLRPLTPAYAAPEQLRGGAATLATDIYSLGVVLCELVSGLRPRGADASFDRAPTLPSALATSGGVDASSPASRARARGIDPASLRRRLSGDLDAIVAKALQEDPDRRYPSAEALSRDVSRHLSGLPVEAAPGSALYRARKFVSRHRFGVASVCAFTLALLAGLVGTSWQARQKAIEARKAEVVKEFALGLFAAADPSLAQGDEVTALELVAKGAERIETDLAGQPEVQAEMEQLLGNVFWNLGRSEQGLELVERALGRTSEATSSAGRANALRSKGGILVDLGRPEDAEPFLREALAMHERTLGPLHPEVAEDLDRLVLLSMARGNLDEARELAERSLSIRQQSLGGDHIETADSLNNLGVLQRQAGDYSAAEESYRQALAIRQAQLGDRHPDTLDSLGNFGSLLHFRGRYEEARQLFAEVVVAHDAVFGSDHPSSVRARNNLAAPLAQLGRLEEAEALYREVLAYWAETTGLDHPNALGTQSSLGLIDRMRGRLEAAEASDRSVLARAIEALGEDHPLSARFAGRLADTLREAGHLDEARVHAQRSLEVHERKFGPEAPQVASDLQLAGVISAELGELDLARSQLRRALDLRIAIHGTRSVFTSETQVSLGDAARRARDLDTALDLLQEGLDTSRALLPEGHAAIARSAWLLGRALLEADRLAEAEALLMEADTVTAAAFGADSWRGAAVRVDLGICRLRNGQPEQGRRMVEAALEELEDQLGAAHRLSTESTRRLFETSKVTGIQGRPKGGPTRVARLSRQQRPGRLDVQSAI